jgi:Spy/CpxP family protein refolding chaperone
MRVMMLTLLGLLISAAITDAQPVKAKWWAQQWWENPKVVSALNLSQEQQKRIQQVVQRKRDLLLDLYFSMRQRGLALQHEVRRSNFDIERARQMSDAFQRARADFQRELLDTLLEIRAVLTQQQVLKLDRIKRLRRRAAFGRLLGLMGPLGGVPQIQ